MPEVLFVQEDNSGKDNKNSCCFAFFGYLVKLKVFHQVILTFLPVGHTHSKIDQCHSVTAMKLGREDLVTLSQMIAHVRELFTSPRTFVDHHMLDTAADFDEFFKGLVNDFSGHGTRRIDGKKRRLHAFRISLKDQVPVIEFKEHDEASSIWRGDWRTNKPLPIFKVGAVFPDKLVSVPRTAVPFLEELKLRVKVMKAEFVKAGMLPYFDSLEGLVPEVALGDATNPCGNLMQKVKMSKKTADLVSGVQWFEQFIAEEVEAGPSIGERREGFELHWPSYRQPSEELSDEAARILAALDSMNLQVVEDALICNSKIKSFLSSCVELERDATCRAARDGTALYLAIGSDRPDAVHAGSTYDPVKDCIRKQFVIVMLDPEETTFKRGWEVGIVSKIHGSRFVDVRYLEPASGVTPSGWSPGWEHKKLNWMRAAGGQKLVAFSPKLPIASVVWSTNLKKTTRMLYARDVKTVSAQIQRIVDYHLGLVANHYLEDVDIRDRPDDCSGYSGDSEAGSEG